MKPCWGGRPLRPYTCAEHVVNEKLWSWAAFKWGSSWKFLEKMFLGKTKILSLSVNSFIWNAPPRCLKFENNFFKLSFLFCAWKPESHTCRACPLTAANPASPPDWVSTSWLAESCRWKTYLYFLQPDQSGKETVNFVLSRLELRYMFWSENWSNWTTVTGNV